MRLALVAQEYPPETAYGGIGTQNQAKARGLSALGHDVQVISHSTDGKRRETADGAVLVTRIPGMDSWLPIATEEARWLTYSFQVAAAIAELHARSPLDLIEFADWGSEGFVHLLNQTDWNRIPTVIHLHGPIVMFANAIGWPDLESSFYKTARMMEETCMQRADAIFSSSRCSAQWCERYHGVDAQHIPILHTGIDTNIFRPLQIAKAEKPTIVFIGKIERNKGVEVLADAAIRLAREVPGLRLKLIGRGNAELQTQLLQRARLAGYPELMQFAGFVSQAQLPEHLSQAHLFAAPSQYEGGPGFVYLEAMACGLPVIACSGSGAAEVITPGETGFLVPPEDRDGLVEALRMLLSDAPLRLRMGQNAREYVMREADRGSCIRRLEEFYSSVATGSYDKGGPVPCLR